MTGVVVLDLAGVRGVLESGDIAFHHWDEHTQIYFQKGWVHTWSSPLLLKATQARVECYEGGDHYTYSYPISEPLDAWQYREEAAHFLQALRSGAPFRSSGEDTLTDVRLCEEIYTHYLGLHSNHTRNE
jgi:predicted dehydrogenase